MEASLFDLLVRTTVAASCAIACVLLMRRPVRAWLGAATAYALWLLVPVLMAAAAAPSLRVKRQMVVAAVPALKLDALTAPLASSVALRWDAALLWVWVAGAVAVALLFMLAHRHYTGKLGKLSAQGGGVFAASTSRQGPALLGLWRPRIVLPADFATRYTEREQALIIAHEQRHAARRDPLANALIALLQCAFWFNPLVHLAASRCRFDQELACDADVMTDHPGQLRDYAAAMLKTQVGGNLAPLTCQWQASHPLKERIMQLNELTNKPFSRRAGRALVVALIACGVLGTVAARAQPAPKNTYLVDFRMTFAGNYSSPSVQVGANEPFTLSGEQGGKRWSGDFVVTEGKGGEIWLKSQYTFDGKKGGYHNAGMRSGSRHHVTIMDDFDKGTMIMVIDEGVTLMPPRAAP